MSVPCTATYQSWHPQHIPELAQQLGPTMPGFDEHERQSIVDSSQQAVGEARTLLPGVANFSMPLLGSLQHQAVLQPTHWLPASVSDLQDLYMEMLVGFHACCLPHSRILQFLNTAIQNLNRDQQHQQHQQQRIAMHSSHMIARPAHPPVDHTRRAAAQNNVRNPTAGPCMLQLQRPTAANIIPSAILPATLLITL